LDLVHHSDNEARCICAVIWGRDPNTIALEAALGLKELYDRPSVAWHFADHTVADACRPRSAPVQALSYEILIHLDQVIDYRPPSVASVDWPE
jgi:hypothetical protein